MLSVTLFLWADVWSDHKMATLLYFHRATSCGITLAVLFILLLLSVGTLCFDVLWTIVSWSILQPATAVSPTRPRRYNPVHNLNPVTTPSSLRIDVLSYRSCRLMYCVSVVGQWGRSVKWSTLPVSNPSAVRQYNVLSHGWEIKHVPAEDTCSELVLPLFCLINKL